jgi:hypothetical protein
MPSREVRERVRWRFIPGWPGYRVSTAGEVECCRERGPGEYLTERWRRLKKQVNEDGYEQVGLWANGIKILARVNTLVLITFVGPKPDGMQSCHRNGVRHDNRPENLRWGTAQSNIDDREAHGNTARGERSGQAKLTREAVAEIRRLRAEGRTFMSLAREFGVSKRQVMRVVRGEAWVHLRRTVPEITAPKSTPILRHELLPWDDVRRTGPAPRPTEAQP